MIPTLDVDSVLSDHDSIFDRAAYVSYQKIRKPSTMDLEDLKQEAISAGIKAINNWDPSKGANISTWIGFIVERHMYDIVWYSYRKVDTADVEDMDAYYHNPFKTEQAVASIELMDMIANRFSRLEQHYIKLCILEKSNDPKNFRVKVREQLNISEDIEDVLRRSIKEILLNVKSK